jgi:hypothetical protein
MHTHGVDELGELVPLFIRQDVYLSFLGMIHWIEQSQSDAMRIDPSFAEEPGPKTELETSENDYAVL